MKGSATLCVLTAQCCSRGIAFCCGEIASFVSGLFQVKEYVDSSDGLEEVLEEDARAKQEIGIRGVPYYVIRCSSSEVKHTLSRAQSVAAFTQAFNQAIEAKQ